MLGLTTVSVSRPPAPDGNGKIGAPVAVSGLGAVPVQIDPASREQVPDVASEVLYRSFIVQTLYLPLPDIRVRDVLTDTNDTDPLTGQPPQYLVRGARTWKDSHLDLWCERQQGV